jgi:archaellum component FlaC
MSLTIEQDLKEVLNKLDAKIDRLDAKIDGVGKDVTDLKVSVVRLEEKVDSMGKRLEKVESSQDSVVKDLADLKGAKSLIVPLIVAVTTSLLTLLIRVIPNP